MKRSIICCAAVSAALLSVRASLADSLTLRQGLNGYSGTRDDAAKLDGSYAYENLDDNLYAYSPIYGSNLGAVVGFDLSSVPAGATINSASLQMTFSSANFLSGNENAWDIKNPSAQWVEGQVSYYFAQNTGAGVKWNPADDVFGPNWNIATGITMATQPLVTSNYISGYTLTGVPLSFDVTSMVNGWVNGGQENRGFAVIHERGDPGGHMEWAGKGNANDTWRPTLTIDYTPLVPGWIAQSGDWHSATNWAGPVPNGVGAVANFKSSITAPRSVYADIATTVGTINFDNANTYVIGGAGTLSLQASSGAAGINVISGSHKINLPLIFVSDTLVTVAGGSTLTIGNPATIKANKTVTKTGSLLIQAPLTIETGGALVLGPGGASLFSAPSLSTGAKIDVQSGSLTINYQGQSSPASTILTQLTSGYHNGAWDGEGIRTSSSTAAVGLGWTENSATSSIQIQRAYYGDANLSGNVDSVDFNAFVAAYGKTTGGIWASGDFNYDGKVNTKDFNYVAGNFGQTLAAPALGSVVPEPASISLLLIGSTTLLSRRQRGTSANVR